MRIIVTADIGWYFPSYPNKGEWKNASLSSLATNILIMVLWTLQTIFFSTVMATCLIVLARQRAIYNSLIIGAWQSKMQNCLCLISFSICCHPQFWNICKAQLIKAKRRSLHQLITFVSISPTLPGFFCCKASLQCALYQLQAVDRYFTELWFWDTRLALFITAGFYIQIWNNAGNLENKILIKYSVYYSWFTLAILLQVIDIPLWESGFSYHIIRISVWNLVII